MMLNIKKVIKSSLSQSATNVFLGMLFSLLFALSYSTTAKSFNGFVITVINDQNYVSNLGVMYDYKGNIVRYEINENQIKTTRILYDGADATRVTLSADGKRILYFTDTSMVLIDSKSGEEISSINMDTKIVNYLLRQRHWPVTANSEWLLFIPTDHAKNLLEEHSSIMALNILTGKIKKFAEFNTGLVGFFASVYVDQGFGELIVETENGKSYSLDLSQENTIEKITENPMDVTCGWGLSFDGQYALNNSGSHREGVLINRQSSTKESISMNMFEKNVDKKMNEWMSFVFPRNDHNAFMVSQLVRSGPITSSSFATLYDVENKEQLIFNKNKRKFYEIPVGLYSSDYDEIIDEYSLGRFAGESPYLLELNSNKPYSEVDFGNGKSATYLNGQLIKHKYEQEGDYTLTLITKDKKKHKALIRVHPKKTLNYKSHTIFNDYDLALKFDHSIANYEILNLSLNETLVNKFLRRALEWLNGNLEYRWIQSYFDEKEIIKTRKLSNFLHIRTNKPVVISNVELELESEQGEKLDFQIDIKKDDRLTDDLLFQWDSDITTNFSLGHNYINSNDMEILGERDSINSVESSYNYDGALELGKTTTYTVPNDTTLRILSELNKSKSFTIDLEFDPVLENPERRKQLFKLSNLIEMHIQNNRLLVFLDANLKEPYLADECLIDDKINTLTVYYADEKLKIFHNDQKCFGVNTQINSIGQKLNDITFAGWLHRTHLGHYRGEWPKNKMRAKLYSLRVYSKRQSLPAIRVSRHKNKFPSSKTAKAKLVEKSYAPRPREVLPYRKVLMLNKYLLETPHFMSSRNVDETGQMIGVAEWSMIDAMWTDVVEKKTGQVYELELIPFDKIERLQQEYVSDTIEGSYDLEVYYSKN